MHRDPTRDPIPYSRFASEVRKYPTKDVLLDINRLSRRIEDEPQGFLRIEIPQYVGRIRAGSKNIHVAQFELAFLAKMAILHSNDYRSGHITPTELLRLANNVLHIADISAQHTPQNLDDVHSVLIRLAYEQFPLGHTGFLLPRTLYLYDEANTLAKQRVMSIDPAAEFEKLLGMTVQQFAQVGACIFAWVQDNPLIHARNLTQTPEENLKPILTDAAVNRVLDILSLDYQGFREEARRHKATEPGLERYEFNPLWDYPIVRLRNGSFCVPVPRILLHRITRGIDFSLRKHFQGQGKENPFATVFGISFEEYVGLLLRSSFGDSSVYGEPKYGKEEKRGPDWTVVLGDEALVIECRSGLVRHETKEIADIESVLQDLRRLVANTISKLPSKLEDLRNGKTGIDVSNVKKFHLMVVLYDKLNPYGAWNTYIRNEVTDLPEGFFYTVLPIDNFEDLCALTEHVSAPVLLEEWRMGAAKFYSDISLFISEKSSQLGIGNLINPMLKTKLDHFFGQIVLEPAK